MTAASLCLLQPKNNFTQAKQPQIPQRRTMPRDWGLRDRPTLRWWSQTPAQLCATSATDASKETLPNQNHFWFPSHPLTIYPAWAKPKHRCHGAVGTSESFWETELAELLELVMCHSDHPENCFPKTRNSSEDYVLQLWIPSAFELTLNLLGRRWRRDGKKQEWPSNKRAGGSSSDYFSANHSESKDM